MLLWEDVRSSDLLPLGPAAERETDAYRPFPNVPWRNTLQQAAEIPLLARCLGPPVGARILEVGCGRGVGLEAIARTWRPHALTGVDIEGHLLDEARGRLRHAGVPVTLVRADVRSLPLPDGAFDLVIDFGTCYHVARPESALREIARVLAPGGLFVHESPLAQLLAHPLRTRGRALPWSAVPILVPARSGVLWSSRRRAGSEGE